MNYLCRQDWSLTLKDGWVNDSKFGCDDVNFDPGQDFTLTSTGCQVLFNYSTTLEDEASVKRNMKKA